MTRTDIAEFIADLLYTLGLVRAWEWVFVLRVPHHIVLTWFWEERDETSQSTATE